MATRPEQLYKDDFYAWTREQAGALRVLTEPPRNGPPDLPPPRPPPIPGLRTRSRARA